MEVGYSLCIGIIMDKVVLSRSHFYSDGKAHEFGSDGICSDCLRIRKEYLNKKRESEIIKSFTEEDINELESLALKMYGGK